MNKQKKHTPGPWKLSTKRYEGKRGVMMATETPGLNILVADVLEDADARLIAAAPELLDALRLVLAHDGRLTGADWDTIRDAVDKAEGGEE